MGRGLDLGCIQRPCRQRLLGMTRLTSPPALLLALVLFLGGLACGAPTRAAPQPRATALSASSYLPVSDAEMAEALRAPAITCVSAATASGCAADLDLHPNAPEPASAQPGVL